MKSSEFCKHDTWLVEVSPKWALGIKNCFRCRENISYVTNDNFYVTSYSNMTWFTDPTWQLPLTDIDERLVLRRVDITQAGKLTAETRRRLKTLTQNGDYSYRRFST